MFLRFIKDFSLKKIIKNSLSNYQPTVATGKVLSVGVVLDESYFNDKEALVSELVSKGIARNAIETLSFLESVKKGQEPKDAFFTRGNISATGSFNKNDVEAFINKTFDMLISYYDVDKPPLMLATIKSKAKFKVGFATTNDRLDNFMISLPAEKYKEFVAELFKYLKILNKI
ncbi:hypothetical protein GR160_02290 [Flavobacterium sp. Sd200]|uniref:DUF6913 domain-containing protein n=1 Tax=Flavobacterium sp. Sd200 TaxID=2692211 RepID=UPI00136A9781|nr:hypothetical protein [Flavobacterium sp. Sd200]MXN90043.1 hypothetical protein [Flavobacterium sp. Sd200]